MTLAGQVGFLLLVLASIGTVIALGSPKTYRDRGLGRVLIGMAWTALLFDGGMALAVLGFATGRWVAYVLLLFLYLRIPAQAALLWVIVVSRRRS